MPGNYSVLSFMIIYFLFLSEEQETLKIVRLPDRCHQTGIVKK